MSSLQIRGYVNCSGIENRDSRGCSQKKIYYISPPPPLPPSSTLLLLPSSTSLLLPSSTPLPSLPSSTLLPSSTPSQGLTSKYFNKQLNYSSCTECASPFTLHTDTTTLLQTHESRKLSICGCQHEHESLSLTLH